MGMISASEHENTAHNQVMNDQTEDAKVYAILAVASAIDRLADAVENAGIDATPPRRTGRKW